jgi:hypothetical protein
MALQFWSLGSPLSPRLRILRWTSRGTPTPLNNFHSLLVLHIDYVGLCLAQPPSLSTPVIRLDDHMRYTNLLPSFITRGLVFDSRSHRKSRDTILQDFVDFYLVENLFSTGIMMGIGFPNCHVLVFFDSVISPRLPRHAWIISKAFEQKCALWIFVFLLWGRAEWVCPSDWGPDNDAI